MRLGWVLLCAWSCGGCLLPALVGGNHLTADELDEGTVQFGLENELSRRLDSRGVRNDRGEIADLYWLSSDLSARVGVTSRLGLETGVKWVWFLPFPIPMPVGLYGGAIWRFDSGVEGLTLAARGQLFGGDVASSRRAGEGVAQTSSYRFGGGTVSLLATLRPAPWVALTASPFVRFVAFHHVETGSSALDQSGVIGSGGASLNLQLRLWAVEVTPMVMLEVASNPYGGPVIVAPMGGFGLTLRF